MNETARSNGLTLRSIVFIAAVAIGLTSSLLGSVALAQDVPESALTPAAAVTDAPPVADKSAMARFQDDVDTLFGKVVGWIAPILFVEVGYKYGVPLIVVVLIAGGLFFTSYLGFVNVRMFRHSLRVIRGKFSRKDDHGEVTHFQALTSALSATVGLGNIAGVAVAITLGGPGAVFWMWVVGFLGMSMKFAESTLAQAYRSVASADGSREHVLGGPFMYLDHGIRERLRSLGVFGVVFGKFLAVVFALFTITGSIGGGNMFQGNQTYKIVSDITGLSHDYAWAGGLLMAAMVGVVIIGGIRRIGEVTSKLVPGMCVFYCTVCLIIIVSNAGRVPEMFAHIFAEAFSFEAGVGGFLGVFIQGAKRAAFSNEAGLGSSAIAHSAAKTAEPIREGAVAMMEPFIDTLVICTMTALTILITQSHLDPSTGVPFTDPKGVTITATAFASLASWLPYLLAIAVFTFAYSTMISWSYYGERASEYLFGRRAIMPYRVMFLVFVVLGPMVSLNNLIDFTDLLILSMAYPNILGMVILAPRVAEMLRDYLRRLKSGEICENP